jgi:ATP-dependent helicase/nuclease subunit A
VLGIAPEEGGSAVEAAAAPGGRPMQISQSSLDARARGSLVHRLLEGLDFSHVAPPAPDVVARAARELGASLPEGEARAVGELVAAVAGTELGARLAAAPRVLREHSFAFLLAPAQTLIIGAVDAIAYELGGRCLVVDYKSDRVEGEDLETLTERHYGVQRRIYGLAALRAGALEVDVAHWYLARPGAPVSVHYDASDADALADQLVARTRALQAGEFAVAPIPHRELCRTCPGRRDLCVYDEAQTMRPWAQTLADEQPHAQG